MATFDVDAPNQADKIRNWPTQVTENWTAIVEGDSTFTQERINISSGGGTPTTQDGMIRLFSALDDQDPARSQLWYKNEAGTAVQITETLGIGSITTTTYADSISFDNSLYYWGNLFCSARGSISSSALVEQDEGIDSATHDGTGEYTVLIEAGRLLVDSYQVLVNPLSTSTTNAYIAVVSVKPVPVSITTTSIEIKIWNVTTGALADRSFEIVIMGGR